VDEGLKAAKLQRKQESQEIVKELTVEKFDEVRGVVDRMNEKFVGVDCGSSGSNR
jgi:hypothetical protein